MQFIQDDPIHPGVILREEFLAEYGFPVGQVAADIGVPRQTLEEIVAERSGVTAELALRLSRYFENSPEFWLNLQRSHDLAVASKRAEGLDKIRPVRVA